MFFLLIFEFLWRKTSNVQNRRLGFDYLVGMEKVNMMCKYNLALSVAYTLMYVRQI